MKTVITNDKQNKEYSRRELLKMAIPKGIFPNKGNLLVDNTKCTGCALCTQECLTGALTAEGDTSLSLVFQYQKCNACGDCIEICPEKCLKLESGNNESPQVILFEDEYARCTNCGVVIGSHSMIKQIQAKIGSKSQNMIKNLYLCPACKG